MSISVAPLQYISPVSASCFSQFHFFLQLPIGKTQNPVKHLHSYTHTHKNAHNYIYIDLCINAYLLQQMLLP